MTYKITHTPATILRCKSCGIIPAQENGEAIPHAIIQKDKDGKYVTGFGGNYLYQDCPSDLEIYVPLSTVETLQKQQKQLVEVLKTIKKFPQKPLTDFNDSDSDRADQYWSVIKTISLIAEEALQKIEKLEE